MTASIRAASSPGEVRVAVVRDNQLLDYALWRPGVPDGVGDVHRGRVIAHVPAMAGAFVALADGEGFLPDSESGQANKDRNLTAGTILTVRITRSAQGNKGPRLTARVENAPTDGPFGLVRRGPGPVTRFATLFPDAPILLDDAGLAADLCLGARATIIRAVFNDDLEEEIDALSRSVIEVPGGARIIISPTPALVAIDVDAAGALAQAGSARARHEALNRAAIAAVARQIRLRNLSGGIVVDLAGLSPRKRVALAPDFSTALANDPLKPKFLGFTALGLAEIVRARVHPPLHELLAGHLAAGLEALRAVLAAFGHDPRGLAAVRAHPAVVSALQGDPAALTDLLRRTGRRVRLRSDPSLPATAWVLEKDDG